MDKRRAVVSLALLLLLGPRATRADEAVDLRLVPFPKKVHLAEGTFALDRPLVLEVPADPSKSLGRMLTDELKRAGDAAPEVRATQRREFFRLSTGGPPPLSPVVPDLPGGVGCYQLRVRPSEVTCDAREAAGLFYGMQTLCQLIRANRREGGIPCLGVQDWPSLRWRAFQDDMTRGPSSTLDTLQFEVALGAHLKMNLFTYYMEYQYAFRKHPLIGPKNGSLEPQNLRALVDYAREHHVDILGNQQSFGHFEDILKHDRYAPLRETPSLLCPVKEESYQLLDDLYSEVCPLLPFELFNVCCDETWGLGTGPSKALADRIGVGGVYVQHVRRVHDILKDKYQKRMMMWGDIILQHPDQLEKIPKDTIMLTWGYGARASFENQIIPFANSGYEFFVCPGISNWSRILPDFGTATVNIRNFVRDGAKHGAVGMLNTAWEDDGEALQGYKWHGYAWGAECAWNASATTPEDFNRRIGAVLFGEKGDHFGQAIELLSQTHRMAGMQGMNNKRFWQDDFLTLTQQALDAPVRSKTSTERGADNRSGSKTSTQRNSGDRTGSKTSTQRNSGDRTGSKRPARSPGDIRKSAERLLGVVRRAIEHLEACQAEATVNEDLLDRFLFGARRMELIGQRMLDGLEAARLYRQACDGVPEEAPPLLAKVEALVKKNREAYEALAAQFKRLWLAESKPYALDWTLNRYAAAVKRYDELAARLAKARKEAAAGKRPVGARAGGSSVAPGASCTAALEPAGAR